MPTWVFNSLTFSGPDAHRTARCLLNDEGAIDFRMLVPEPNDLERLPDPSEVAPDLAVELALASGALQDVDLDDDPLYMHRLDRMPHEQVVAAWKASGRDLRLAATRLAGEGKVEPLLRACEAVVNNARRHGVATPEAWRLREWGCTTNALEGAIHEEEDACQIGFDTIGSAPVWIAIRLDARIREENLKAQVEWQAVDDADEILFEVILPLDREDRQVLLETYEAWIDAAGGLHDG